MLKAAGLWLGQEGGRPQLIMFNTDHFTNARWNDLYTFFLQGEPPLIVKLLAINTIFFILFILRSATSRHRMRHSTAYAVQGLLIAANFLAMFQNEAMLAYHSVRTLF